MPSVGSTSTSGWFVRVAWYVATRTGVCATSRRALRWLASVELSEASGSSTDKRGHERAQRLHRRPGPGHVRHQHFGRLADAAGVDELVVERVELGLRRERATLEQVHALLERDAARDVVDVVPAVEQPTGLAIHVRQRRRRGDDVCETARGGVGHAEVLQMNGALRVYG